MACESDVGRPESRAAQLPPGAASLASQQLVTSVRPRLHHGIQFCLTNNHYTSTTTFKLTRSQWYHCHPPKNSKCSHTDHIIIQLGILKFQTLLLVVLLFICTCTYLHGVFPAFLDRNKNGYVEKPLGRRILRKREIWNLTRCTDRLEHSGGLRVLARD